MSEPRIIVYTPDSLLTNPLGLWRAMMSDLASSRELAWRLTVRDLSAQYRQALLGILWALILPLANTLVWILLSRSGIVRLSDTALPYPVYVFTGTMLWAVLLEALNAPLLMLNSSKSMLSKINFPREALVLAGIYKTLVNAMIKVPLLIAAMLYMGVYPNWEIVLFPLGLLSLVLVGTTVGLMLTPIGMLYTDIGKSIPLIMQFLMYLSPVVFAMPKDGLIAELFRINPLTPIILTARDWLTGMSPEFIGYFCVVNAIALILLLMSWVVFRLAMPILIERMGS